MGRFSVLPWLPGSAAVSSRRAVAAAGLCGIVLAGAVVVPEEATAANATVSLWSSASPKHLDRSRSGPAELGVRFRSDVAGSVTGVRFYKKRERAGHYTGSLWTTSGKRLATATFAKTSGSGWHTVTFSKPVRIKAHTTYVASYHTTSGHYAANKGYFADHAKHRGPLHASKGVRHFGQKATFPGSTVETNYFVDVRFRRATKTSAPITPPPPVPSSGGVAYGWQLTAANTGLAGAGVDRNSLPVYSGPITSGMTISQKRLGDVDLSRVSNVTLDRVWIRSNSQRALILGPGTVIKDSDIDGSTAPQGERDGIFGETSGYTIQRVAITGMSVGVWLDGNGSGTMTETYIHDMVSTGGAHVDGFTRRGGTGALTIDRSRIDASGSSVTGAFFLQDTWGDRIGGITLSNSYVEGQGYLIFLENKGAGVAVGLNNVRTRPVGWGDATRLGTSITFDQWTGVNRYDASKPPSAAGKIVNRP